MAWQWWGTLKRLAMTKNGNSNWMNADTWKWSRQTSWIVVRLRDAADMYKMWSAFHWVSPMDQIQKQHGCDWPAKTKLFICFFSWERKIENLKDTADFKEEIQLFSFSARIDLDGTCSYYTLITMSEMWKEWLIVMITWFCSSSHLLLICFYCLIWSCCSCWQFFQQQAAVFSGKAQLIPLYTACPVTNGRQS